MKKGEVILRVPPRIRWKKIFEIVQDGGFRHCYIRCPTQKELSNAYSGIARYKHATDTNVLFKRWHDGVFVTFLDISPLPSYQPGQLIVTIGNRDTIHCYYDPKPLTVFDEWRIQA